MCLSSYILPDASHESCQKTRLVKNSISPTYNHTMVYDGFHTSDLREACAELTVWQRDGMKTHILGGVRLSSGTGEGASSHHRVSLQVFRRQRASVIIITLDFYYVIIRYLSRYLCILAIHKVFWDSPSTVIVLLLLREDDNYTGGAAFDCRSELWRECQLDGLHRGGGRRVGLHDQKSQLLD